MSFNGYKKPLGPWLYALTLYTLLVLVTPPLALIFACAVVFIVARALRTEGEAYRSMKYALILAAMIVLFNLIFVQHGGRVLYHLHLSIPIGSLVLSWSIIFTLNALIYGMVMGIRLILIIGLFAAVTTAIEPEDVFMYSRGKVPLIIAIGVRFIGLFEMDAARIVEGQRARGILGHRRMALLRNARNLMYPLLYRSLNRTDELSSVLEMRGYGMRHANKEGSYGRMGRLWLPLIIGTVMSVLIPVLHIPYMPPGVPIYIRILGLGEGLYLATIYAFLALVFMPFMYCPDVVSGRSNKNVGGECVW